MSNNNINNDNGNETVCKAIAMFGFALVLFSYFMFDNRRSDITQAIVAFLGLALIVLAVLATVENKEDAPVDYGCWLGFIMIVVGICSIRADKHLLLKSMVILNGLVCFPLSSYLSEAEDKLKKIIKYAIIIFVANIAISFVAAKTDFFEYLGIFLVILFVLSIPYFIGDAAVKGVSAVTGVDEDTVLKAGLTIGAAMVAKDVIGNIADASNSAYNADVSSVYGANVDASSVTGVNVDGSYIPNGNPDLVHVDGYYRQDGTYVRSHVRTSPNNITGDNISSHK